MKAKRRARRGEIIVAPYDVRLVCTSCGRRTPRVVGDLYAAGVIKKVGQSPPAIMLDECPECGFLPHFIDLEIDPQWWNKYR